MEMNRDKIKSLVVAREIRGKESGDNECGQVLQEILL